MSLSYLLASFSPTSTRVGKIKLKLTPRIPQRVQKLPWCHIGRVHRQKKGEASPGSLGIEECSGCSSYLHFQALAGQAFFSPLWGCQQATCHIRAPLSSSGPRSVEKAQQRISELPGPFTSSDQQGFVCWSETISGDEHVTESRYPVTPSAICSSSFFSFS